MAETAAQQPPGQRRRLATVGDVMRPPLTTVDQNDHVAAAAYLIDRKSTRLNSSHPSISYAVFCLKKKKNKDYIVARQTYQFYNVCGIYLSAVYYYISFSI